MSNQDIDSDFVPSEEEDELPPSPSKKLTRESVKSERLNFHDMFKLASKKFVNRAIITAMDCSLNTADIILNAKNMMIKDFVKQLNWQRAKSHYDLL
jgi:hypothetical protein